MAPAEHDGHGRRGGVAGVGDEARVARRGRSTSSDARCSVKNPPVMRYWKRRCSGSWVRIVSSSVRPVRERDRADVAGHLAGHDAREPVVQQVGPADHAPTRCRRRRRRRPRAARTRGSAAPPARRRGRRTPAPAAMAGLDIVDREALVVVHQVERLPRHHDVARPRACAAGLPGGRASSSGANGVGELQPQGVADAGQLGQDQRLACGQGARHPPDLAHALRAGGRRAVDEALDALGERRVGGDVERVEGRQVLLLAGDGGADERVDVVEVAEQRPRRDAGPGGDLARRSGRARPRGTARAAR